jgi:hypothetical protein
MVDIHNLVYGALYNHTKKDGKPLKLSVPKISVHVLLDLYIRDHLAHIIAFFGISTLFCRGA